MQPSQDNNANDPVDSTQNHTPVNDIVAPPLTHPSIPSTQIASSQPDTQTQTPIIDTHPSPGVVVMQWLTYAFWGWTLLALSLLIFLVVFNLLNKTDSGNTSLYALAAIVVLLPISLICDFFYQKYEPKKKQGISMVVMVIHAVIFALFAIGSLIGSLFAVVQLIVDSNGSEVTNNFIAIIISLLIISVLYGLTFLRTLNPLKSTTKVARIFSVTMLIIAGIFTILAFVGPFAQTLQTKNDRLIDNNLTYVETAISNYVDKNNKLPTSLNDVTIQQDEAKQLIEQNLVTYRQDSADPLNNALRYQLCVTYAQKSSQNAYNYSYAQDNDEYQSYLSTRGHKAGEVCYKLRVTSYTSGVNSNVQLFN